MAKKKTPTEVKKAAPSPRNEASKYSNSQMAIGAAVALFLAIVVSTAGTGEPVKYVDVADEATLRSMFFSGEVWAVACHTEGDKTPVPEHFEAVAARLGGEINFAVLDCAAKLPEKKYNTFQRWKLDRSNKPVIFVSNGVKVQQIPAASARSEYDLVRELRLASIRQPAAVRNTETLQEKCLSKPRCLLVLQGGTQLEPGAEKALHAVAGAHANGGAARGKDGSFVAVAALDSQEWRLSIEGFELGDAIKLRRFEAGVHRAVYFRNVSAEEPLRAIALKGDLSEKAMNAFLAGVSLDTDEAPSDRLTSLAQEGQTGVNLLKRTRQKKTPPKAKVAKEAAKPKKTKKGIPETLSPEEREKLINDQREREAKRRDAMEKEGAAYVAEEETEDYEEDDSAGEDEDEEEVEEI